MGMTRDELVAMVRRIQTGDYATEADRDRLLDEVKQNVPDPEVSDLIFWRKPALTAEDIVDRAMAYAPIILPRPVTLPRA
jgi:hypothetical protein